MKCLCEFSPKRANSLMNIKLEIKVSGIHPIGFLVLAEIETERDPNFRLPLSRPIFWGDFSQQYMMMIFLIDIFSASTELIIRVFSLVLLTNISRFPNIEPSMHPRKKNSA